MTENLIFKRQKCQFLAANRQYDPLLTLTLILTKFENRIPNKTYLQPKIMGYRVKEMCDTSLDIDPVTVWNQFYRE